MTYAGAKKQTKLEMEKTLEIENGKNAPEQFQNLTKSLELNKEIKLLTANSIWLHKSLNLKKSYSKLTSEYYNAKSKNVDFADADSREKVRKEINDWVEKQTNKQIKKFIKPGVLTESTGMVLVNAVYFKALWDKAFVKEEISPDEFITASGKSINCEMMNTMLSTEYFEDKTVQAVKIPYKNKEASMIIILPKESTKASIEAIDYKYYTEIIKSFEAKKVKLSIPKFKMEVQYELKKVMNQMGMKSAFSRDADFSGITGAKDLAISKILHQSVIDVTESGTEASSATAVISMRSTMVTKDIPVVFKADKPFLFVIKETSTEAILFMGYLAEPPVFDIPEDKATPDVQEQEQR